MLLACDAVYCAWLWWWKWRDEEEEEDDEDDDDYLCFLSARADVGRLC